MYMMYVVYDNSILLEVNIGKSTTVVKGISQC